MTRGEAALPPAIGLVDAEGKLIEGDERLLALNDHAGGTIGAPIAVPQIATLVRLAQRLRILISRQIVIADGDDDLELWARIDPNVADGHVRVQLSGWRHRPGWRQLPGAGHEEADFIKSGSSWTWETDATLRLSAISLAGATRHGFDVTAIIGQPMTRLFMLQEDDKGVLPILGGLAMRQKFEDQQAIIRPTGQRARIAATARVDRAGNFAGYIGATYMIDDDRSLRPSATTLGDGFSDQLDKALRLPLGRIIANADSINAQAEGPLRQDYVDYAADIANAGRHLLGMIDDLVDLQAIERPDFATAAEPIDLADVARRAAGLLAIRAGAAHVRIDRPGPEEKLPATGEFRRALQIVVNLIGNAVRYSPKGGMIWIKAEREGDTAAIIVADQGKGIAIDDQARIFEKFERIDPGEAGGSGLGLYIARRLARAMGGDLVVDSAPGEGARFVFTLRFRR